MHFYKYNPTLSYHQNSLSVSATPLNFASEHPLTQSNSQAATAIGLSHTNHVTLLQLQLERQVKIPGKTISLTMCIMFMVHPTNYPRKVKGILSSCKGY